MQSTPRLRTPAAAYAAARSLAVSATVAQSVSTISAWRYVLSVKGSFGFDKCVRTVSRPACTACVAGLVKPLPSFFLSGAVVELSVLGRCNLTLHFGLSNSFDLFGCRSGLSICRSSLGSGLLGNGALPSRFLGALVDCMNNLLGGDLQSYGRDAFVSKCCGQSANENANGGFKYVLHPSSSVAVGIQS